VDDESAEVIDGSFVATVFQIHFAPALVTSHGRASFTRSPFNDQTIG